MSGGDEESGGERRRGRKAPTAFRTISEVADELHIPQHVLRFWETKFPQLAPLKRGGGRRYYRPEDVELLRRISDLLYVQGYTIKGVQRLLRDGDAAEEDAEMADNAATTPPAARPQLPLPGLPQAPAGPTRAQTKPVVRVRAEGAPITPSAAPPADRTAGWRAALSELLSELRAIRDLLEQGARAGRRPRN